MNSSVQNSVHSVFSHVCFLRSQNNWHLPGDYVTLRHHQTCLNNLSHSLIKKGRHKSVTAGLIEFILCRIGVITAARVTWCDVIREYRKYQGKSRLNHMHFATHSIQWSCVVENTCPSWRIHAHRKSSKTIMNWFHLYCERLFKMHTNSGLAKCILWVLFSLLFWKR